MAGSIFGMLIALPSTSTTREPLTFAFATYHQTLSSVCSYEMHWIMLLRVSYHFDFLALHIFVYVKLLNTCRLLDLKKTKKSTRQFLTGTPWTTFFNHVIKYRLAGWKALQRPENATTMEKNPRVLNPGENKRAEQTKTNGKIF